MLNSLPLPTQSSSSSGEQPKRRKRESFRKTMTKAPEIARIRSYHDFVLILFSSFTVNGQMLK